MEKPTPKEIADWENRLINSVMKAKYDGDAEKLAKLASEMLGRLRDIANAPG